MPTLPEDGLERPNDVGSLICLQIVFFFCCCAFVGMSAVDYM
jgi:hypothetical protein